ncbi:MAG: acetylglutamate kinase [Euryarchaeota archaeon]
MPVEVIKVGGEVLDRVDRLAEALPDEAVIVHGGGPEISRTMEELGLEPRFVKGLRVTDGETLRVVIMVLAGHVNKRLVAGLRAHGVDAVGLSGVDGGLLLAEKRVERVDGEEVDLGYVGDVKGVNVDLLRALLRDGRVPVIAPLGVDERGTIYNVNADTAAGAIAAEAGADRLVLLTDVPGVLEDVDDPDSVIERLTPEEARRLRREGVIRGGMIPKVEAAVRAVESGCREAVVTNLSGLLSGEGTVIR